MTERFTTEPNRLTARWVLAHWMVCTAEFLEGTAQLIRPVRERPVRTPRPKAPRPTWFDPENHAK